MRISERQVGDAAVVDVVGAVRDRAATTLLCAIGRQVCAGRRLIIVNLQKVPSMDAAGLGALLEAYGAVRQAGGVMRLAGVTGHIHDLVVLTRLLTVFETYDSVDEAAADGAAVAAAAMPPALSRAGFDAIARFLREA